MPFFILTLIIDAAVVIHILKTGRSTMWIWLVVVLGPIGAIAYFVIEILPELTGGRSARRAWSNARRTLDPTRELREAERRLRQNDSIDGRRRMAQELFNAGKYAEAVEFYHKALTGLYENDAYLLLGMAQAQFELGQPTEARTTLDRLIKENPDFKSSEGHLLYARALEGEGNLDKARTEYETLAGYYPGVEARYRFAALLHRSGDTSRARKEYEQILNDAELSTKHFRREQSQWLQLARRDLESLKA